MLLVKIRVEVAEHLVLEALGALRFWSSKCKKHKYPFNLLIQGITYTGDCNGFSFLYLFPTIFI